MDAAALNLATQILGHCRLLFIHLDAGAADARLVEDLAALASGYDDMHVADGHPGEEAMRRGRFQYLRAEPALGRECDVPDPGISRARALIRLEGRAPEPLLTYEHALRALVERRGGEVHTRAGVHKERSYTSHAMTQFAYARAFGPKPGAVCPLGVVTPQNKTPAWWAMDWMQRESFFLPRYDDAGRMTVKGHALASAAGIPCITRRNFHAPDGYGTGSGYDFLPYFEFAEADAPTFRAVMAGLRDSTQNPEWRYVREGPEWWGRRVPHARELFTAEKTASGSTR